MEGKRIQEQIKDLTSKFISTDHVDYNYAINNYFNDSAVIDNPRFTVHGATQIKKVLALNEALTVDSYLIDPQPKWNETEQTVTFSFRRVFALPTLPSYVPLSANINSWRFPVTWDNAELHLFAETEEGENQGGSSWDKKFYVTKVVDKGVTSPIPFDKYIPYRFFRPLSTILLMFAATVAVFFQRHPLSQGIVSVILAFMHESFTYIWNLVHLAIGLVTADVDVWRARTADDSSRVLKKTQDSLQDLEMNIQARAKKAGVPVDELQRQFKTLRETARDVLAAVIEGIEPVHTPQGGTNPKAPGAPSYAAAASTTPAPEAAIADN